MTDSASNAATLTTSSTSSAGRSLRLLSVLADQGRPMALAELIESLDLPKATVHRMCAQLMECGFVSRDLNERDFVVGHALRKLALDTLNHGSLRGLRHEVLAGLVAQLRETCNFTTLDLQPITEHSIATVDALRKECETIRERGYAFDREEFVLGQWPSPSRCGMRQARCAPRSPFMRLPRACRWSRPCSACLPCIWRLSA